MSISDSYYIFQASYVPTTNATLNKHYWSERESKAFPAEKLPKAASTFNTSQIVQFQNEATGRNINSEITKRFKCATNLSLRETKGNKRNVCRNTAGR